MGHALKFPSSITSPMVCENLFAEQKDWCCWVQWKQIQGSHRARHLKRSRHFEDASQTAVVECIWVSRYLLFGLSAALVFASDYHRHVVLLQIDSCITFSSVQLETIKCCLTPIVYKYTCSVSSYLIKSYAKDVLVLEKRKEKCLSNPNEKLVQRWWELIVCY